MTIDTKLPFDMDFVNSFSEGNWRTCLAGRFPRKGFKRYRFIANAKAG